MRSPKSTTFTFFHNFSFKQKTLWLLLKSIKRMLSCIYFKTAIQHLFRNMIISKLTSPSKSAFFLLSLLWIVFSLQSQITLFVYFGKNTCCINIALSSIIQWDRIDKKEKFLQSNILIYSYKNIWSQLKTSCYKLLTAITCLDHFYYSRNMSLSQIDWWGDKRRSQSM